MGRTNKPSKPNRPMVSLWLKLSVILVLLIVGSIYLYMQILRPQSTQATAQFRGVLNSMQSAVESDSMINITYNYTGYDSKIGSQARVLRYERDGNISRIDLLANSGSNESVFDLNGMYYLCKYTNSAQQCQGESIEPGSENSEASEGGENLDFGALYNASLDFISIGNLSLSVMYYYGAGIASYGNIGPVRQVNVSHITVQNSTYEGQQCRMISANFTYGTSASGTLSACLSQKYNLPLTYDLVAIYNSSKYGNDIVNETQLEFREVEISDEPSVQYITPYYLVGPPITNQTPGYRCIQTPSNSSSQWLATCRQYGYAQCQGAPSSGCPLAEGYPDANCGWTIGTPGVMCFDYGAETLFGRQLNNGVGCEGTADGFSNSC